MELGIMFFSSAASAKEEAEKYRLLLEVTRKADEAGLVCVWTPERHFHDFGGLYPSPAVISAGLATVTERVGLRAGSLISPLHDTLRIAEQWSIVDNLSGGRVGISFGSGWNVEDFVFFPDRYERRKEIMTDQIEEVRSLWRGESVERRNSYGRPVSVSVQPRPVQAELPVWVTSSGNPETFARAGRLGANLLTHLIGQDLTSLQEKIELYRRELESHHGEGTTGVVSLMLHTFLAADEEEARSVVREPFREYLRSAVSLEMLAAEGGGAISGGHEIDPHEIPPEVLEELLDLTVERYWEEGALLGTVDGRMGFLGRLEEIGVDEVACLVDFIDDTEAVLGSMRYVCEAQERLREKASGAQAALSSFLDDL